MGMKVIIVAAKATTTMMVNHNRVRRDMRTPCLYTKKSPAATAGAIGKRAGL
jgi:hypothetical protein